MINGEAAVADPVAPGDGQGGGQDPAPYTGGGSPQIPGDGQGQGQGTSSPAPSKEYDGLRRLIDRQGTMLAELQKQLTSKPSPQPSGRADEWGQLSETLGLDERATQVMKKAFESMLNPVNEQLTQYQAQAERLAFFNENPDMRQYEPAFRVLEKGLESGEYSPMQVKALAIRGANIDKIVEERLKSEKAKWEKEYGNKLRASGGSGASARPGEEKANQDRAASIFGLPKATFTNKPPD